MTADFLLVSNERYAKNLGICSYSILHNMCPAVGRVRLFVFDCGLSEKSKERLTRQSARFSNAEIIFHDITGLLEKTASGIDSPWHPTIYGRLLAGELLKLRDDIGRFIYLDCDTLMDKPVSGLFTMDLGGRTLAAVADADEDGRKTALQMPEESVYINSGVLVIDLKAWVERKAEERIIEFMQTSETELLYPDQDAISYVMWDEIKVIPLEYNMMWMICDSDIPKLVRNVEKFPYTAEEVRYALHNMSICHYSGHDMWTFYGITPIQARLFKKYRRLCEWSDEKRSFETPVRFVLWVMKSVKRILLGDLKPFSGSR